MGKRRDDVVSVRLPPKLRARVDELREKLGKSDSFVLRSLLAAALGDDASMIAVAEASVTIDQLRREVLAELSTELGPAFDELRATFEQRARSAR